MKNLTDLECNILNCAKEGLTNSEIAEKLRLNLSMVQIHLKTIYQKLGVTNRVLAAIYCERN